MFDAKDIGELFMKHLPDYMLYEEAEMERIVAAAMGSDACRNEIESIKAEDGNAAGIASDGAQKTKGSRTSKADDVKSSADASVMENDDDSEDKAADRTPKNRMIHRMTTALKRRMRGIIRMKRVIRNKDHGLLLFITSAACMGRFMCGMGSELIGGMLKPKYHSDSAGRRGVMWNRKQNHIIRIRKTTLPSSAVLRS